MKRAKLKLKRRLRRKRHIRKKVFGTPEKPRLSITRSLRNVSCQAIDDIGGVTVLSASTCLREIRDELAKDCGNRKGAERVGKFLAEKAKSAGIKRLCFDRNGYPYHGRIAALAEALRKEGIEV